jgi:hypothetical protein
MSNKVEKILAVDFAETSKSIIEFHLHGIHELSRLYFVMTEVMGQENLEKPISQETYEALSEYVNVLLTNMKRQKKELEHVATNSKELELFLSTVPEEEAARLREILGASSS